MRRVRQPTPRSRTGTRFDAAVAARARMRTRVRRGAVRRVLLLLVTLGFVWLGWQWFWGESWRISEITVVNDGSVPMEAVVAASGLYGKHFLHADPQQAAQAVRSLRGVAQAEVVCSWEWHARCQITVRPPPPLAILEGSRGRVWSDYEGNVQVASPEMKAPLRVQAEAEVLPSPGGTLDYALVRALVELVELPPPDGYYAYSNRYGVIWVTNEQWRIRLGKAEYPGAMRAKLELATRIRQRLREKGESPLVIDVRFVEAPYFVR